MTTAVWWTPDCGYLHLEYDPRVISLACPDGVSYWRTTEPNDDTDDMCPNCVTPWKCNGPHIYDQTPLALRIGGVTRQVVTVDPDPRDGIDVPEVPTDPVDDDGSTPEEGEEP